MQMQTITLNINITWNRLQGTYKWGDTKKHNADTNWSKSNVIYRWVKNSTGDIAYIGETDRQLSARINNYISAKPTSQAGKTNKSVWNEQNSLSRNNDYLFLEFTDTVPGYNLSNSKERRYAEKLLIGYSRPYLQ